MLPDISCSIKAGHDFQRDSKIQQGFLLWVFEFSILDCLYILGLNMPLREDIKCERHFYARLSLIHDNGIDNTIVYFEIVQDDPDLWWMVENDLFRSAKQHQRISGKIQCQSGRLRSPSDKLNMLLGRSILLKTEGLDNRLNPVKRLWCKMDMNAARTWDLSEPIAAISIVYSN